MVQEAVSDISRSCCWLLIAPPLVLAIAFRAEASEACPQPANLFSHSAVSPWLAGFAPSAPPVVKHHVDFADVYAQVDGELSARLAALKPNYVNKSGLRLAVEGHSKSLEAGISEIGCQRPDYG